MSDGVVRLVDVRPVVNEDVVSILEEALSAARCGDLASVMLVGFLSDGGALTSFSATDDVWRDLALLRRLEYRMMSSMDAE